MCGVAVPLPLPFPFLSPALASSGDVVGTLMHIASQPMIIRKKHRNSCSVPPRVGLGCDTPAPLTNVVVVVVVDSGFT